MEAFKMFDSDQNGYIGPSEFKEIMHFLGENISDK